MAELIGVGLYTPAEAARLVRVSDRRIARWLKGYSADGQFHAPLWAPQVDLGDDQLYLGFRDLLEVRVAAAFIAHGVSPQRVRAAIRMAREVYGVAHPLATTRFRTDGKSIFLRIAVDEKGAGERMLDTATRQYVFADVIAASLKGVEFDQAGMPILWRPLGKRGGVLLDPTRAFGQPIDEGSSVPTRVLAAAARTEGVVNAARAYDVPELSVRRALEFEDTLAAGLAA